MTSHQNVRVPRSTADQSDLRWVLSGLVQTASTVHRSLMSMERHHLGRVRASDVNGAMAAIDTLAAFSMALREAANAARQELSRPGRAPRKVAVHLLSQEQYGDAMLFAGRVSVDLRSDDSFPDELNAPVSKEVLQEISDRLNLAPDSAPLKRR
jgi:hypothetical protein